MAELRIPRGDRVVLTTDFTNADGSILDPTGLSVWWTAKRNRWDLDEDAIIRKGLNVAGLTGITLPGSPVNRAEIEILPEDTEDLDNWATLLYYDVQIEVEGSPHTTE